MTEKSTASSSHKHDVDLEANRLGDVVAQACLSVARMTKVVEDTHNLKKAEALLVRQHLEKVSAKAIDSVMDEIQDAHTTADMWQVEKKISAHISHERAKAYGALMEQHRSESKLPTGKDGPGSGSSKMAEVEEEFHKSISDLISTTITEVGKVPGGHMVALTSNILWLVPNLPLNLVLAPCIDLLLKKRVQDHLGRDTKVHPSKSWCPEFSPQFAFNWRNGCPHVYQQIYHNVWSGHDLTHYLCATSYRTTPSSRSPYPSMCWHPQKGGELQVP